MSANSAAFEDADFTKADIVGDVEDAQFPDATFEDAEIDTEGRARGGAVRRGGFSLVGEEGPELVARGADGYDIPNGPSMAIIGASGGATVAGGGAVNNVTVHVHVSGSVMAERDLALAIRDQLIRVGRSNAGGIFGGYA